MCVGKIGLVQIVPIVQSVVIIVRRVIVDAGDEQVQELLEAALGCGFRILVLIVFEIVVVALVGIAVVEALVIRSRTLVDGRLCLVDILDGIRLRIFLRIVVAIIVRRRRLPAAEETLAWRGIGKVLIRNGFSVLRHIVRFISVLCAAARGDSVLYAVEEANEGIKGVRILIFLFRGFLFVLILIHEDVLVILHGFVKVLRGEILHRLGRRCIARLLGRGFLQGLELVLNRPGARRLGRPCRLGLRRRGRSRPARTGLEFLMPAAKLVIIQFGAVVSGIVHSVTASHCTKRVRGISIRIHYINIPIF